MTLFEDPNPYRAPRGDVAVFPKTGFKPRNAKLLCIGWLAVFALNLIVPGWLGWRFTEQGGRMGMLLGATLVLAIGCCVCVCARQIGFSLVVGGAAVALSQVLPLLQLLAGVASCALAEAAGLYFSVDDTHPAAVVGGELGGFVITITTGASLIAAPLAAGLLALRAFGASFG